MKSFTQLLIVVVQIVLSIICFGATLTMADTSISGHFSIIWGDEHSGESDMRYQLTDDNQRTTQISLDESLSRSLGGILGINQKRVNIQGAFPSSRSSSSSPVFQVTSISLATTSQSVNPLPVSSVSAAVSGSKPWVTIMCKFSDKPDEPNDLNFFQEMYSSSFPGLDHYWREQSFDTVNVAGSNASGWFTLPHTEAYYNPDDVGQGTDLNALANDCINAADPSVDFSGYSGINMMFNTDFDNGWAWGGTRYMTLDGITKVWSTTWEPPWSYSNVAVIAHEMGHGFGLPHSSGAYGQTYDNVWDVMSDTWTNCANSTDATYGCLGQHTISYHKSILGWIPSDKQYFAAGNTTITIDHLALSATANYRMAHIPIDGSSSHFYTVEVRQKEGYDIKLPGKAVIIHEVDTTRSRPAYVIDSDGDGDTADEGAMLVTGETFTDSAHDISVSVVSSTSAGFEVQIIAPEIPPEIPTNIAATDGLYTDKVRIAWNAVNNATAYKVYRCTDSSTTSCTLLTTELASPYDDVNANPGTTYYYRIKATNNAGDSEYSNYDTGYAALTPPETPQAPNATDGTYTDKVTLAWNSVSGATSYKMYRCTDSSTASCILLATDLASPYDDFTANPGTTYYYRIKAVNDAGDSAYSNYDTGYAALTPPETPQAPNATDGTYTDKVTLAWNSVNNAISYKIYRCTDSSTASCILLATELASPYDDVNANPGTTYYYRIKAVNDAGDSAYSNYDTGYKSIPPPATPEPPKATDGRYIDKVQVSWNPVATATSYKIYRCTNILTSSCTYLVSTSAGFYDDTNCIPDTIYYYRMKASNASGDSGYSNYDTGYSSSEALPPQALNSILFLLLNKNQAPEETR